MSKKKSKKKKPPAGERTLASPIKVKVRSVKKIRLTGLKVKYQTVTHEEKREDIDENGRAVIVRTPQGPARRFSIDVASLSVPLQNRLLDLAEQDAKQATDIVSRKGRR